MKITKDRLAVMLQTVPRHIRNGDYETIVDCLELLAILEELQAYRNGEK